MTKDERRILDELDEFDSMVRIVEQSGIILSHKHFIRKAIFDQFNNIKEKETLNERKN